MMNIFLSRDNKRFLFCTYYGREHPAKGENIGKKETSKTKTEKIRAKLPAGTPKAKKNGVYTATQTQDPPVPNRAHTEM